MAGPNGSTPQGTATPPASGAGSIDPWHRPDWVIRENDQVGSSDFLVPDDSPDVWGKVRGYASASSVNRGDTFRLSVSTDSPTWRVQAYRIGWYRGTAGRLVWESGDQPRLPQPEPQRDPRTRMVSAGWTPNMEITADGNWPPGMYLLKLLSSDGGQSLIPLVVRDDASPAALVIQSSHATFQAYNSWGGANVYTSETAGENERSRVVSFDRPYYRRGAGEFFGREYEFVLFAERLGLDLTYWSSLDLHERAPLLTRHKGFVSLGHDEYYSAEMRSGLEAAIAAGVNVVFLGANACYRKIRFEPGPDGTPNRLLVNYRNVAEDPTAVADPTQATVSWREAPVNSPESSLIGNFYESNPVDADMVITEPDAWVFEGTGLRAGDRLAGLVGNEYDRVTPEQPTPASLEVFCHSPVVVKGKASFADVTWYTSPSGAGVFASGTLWWVPSLDPGRRQQSVTTMSGRPSVPTQDIAVQKITENLLAACAAGPAGRAHPSRPNLAALGIRPGYIPDPPA